MTDALVHALESLEVVRTGHVVRNPDGTPLRDGQTTDGIQRICRRVLGMFSARTPRLGHGRAATPFGFRPLVRVATAWPQNSG